MIVLCASLHVPLSRVAGLQSQIRMRHVATYGLLALKSSSGTPEFTVMPMSDSGDAPGTSSGFGTTFRYCNLVLHFVVSRRRLPHPISLYGADSKWCRRWAHWMASLFALLQVAPLSRQVASSDCRILPPPLSSWLVVV